MTLVQSFHITQFHSAVNYHPQPNSQPHHTTMFLAVWQLVKVVHMVLFSIHNFFKE